MTDIDLYGDEPFDTNAPPPELVAHDPDVYQAANRHLRAIGRLEQRAADIRAVFYAEIERLETRMAELVNRVENDIDWHRRPLTQLHAAVLAEDPSRKTLQLPAGAIKSRTPRTPTINVFDIPQFIDWASTNAPHLLKSKPTVNREALKAAAQPCGDLGFGDSAPAVLPEVGEVIPGVEFVLGITTFHIEPTASTHELDALPEEAQQ
jgi:phage host-nuclease inhibitor protein Gam